LKYSPEAIKAIEERAVLKKVTDLGECADMFVSIVKNTSMTGQRIAVGKCRAFSPFVSISDQDAGLFMIALELMGVNADTLSNRRWNKRGIDLNVKTFGFSVNSCYPW
jgi:hypothetical protein